MVSEKLGILLTAITALDTLYQTFNTHTNTQMQAHFIFFFVVLLFLIAFVDDCVLQTTLLPGRKSKTTFFVITCILLLLVIGAIVFIWRKAQTKTQPVNKGRYEKLTNHSKTFPSSVSNYHKSPSYHDNQVIEYRDRDYEDDDDDEDDIVYMGKDGTIYHKFKYGLLEDDEEDELEYDDESYSFR